MSARPDRTAAPPRECDVAVVGGGIVGLAAARALSERDSALRVAVLEREPALATYQTGHSSGVIHAGLYYAPGSLKARLCVEGAARLYEYCAAHRIETRRSGKLVLAVRGSELPRLDELERRAVANGADVRRLDGPDDIRAIEPRAAGIAGLHSPATGVVDFGAVAEGFGRDVEAGGGSIAVGCAVTGIVEDDLSVALTHRSGTTKARTVIFCGGRWADRLAESAGADPDPRIVPFRGAYLELRPERASLVRGLIYPVPDPELPFLGVHLTRMIDGRVMVGPTALLKPDRRALAWPGTWRMVRRWWQTGLTEIHHALSPRSLAAEAARFIPELGAADLRRSWSGVRAQAVGRDGALIDDFEISTTPRTLHVRNAPSPAATASLALADLIVDRLEELGAP